MPERSSMRRLLLVAAACLCVPVALAAQQLTPPSTGGVGALDRALGRLTGNKRVLVIAAHPDDEDTELLTFLSRAWGVDAAYLSLSRGEGGQNLIGSELGEALGLIRTGELLAARSMDGAHQFFTRGFDFGFSKSLAETDQFWPRDTILADVLRVIRRFRPQVLIAIFSGTPRDGHGQHQQSGVLVRQAFELLKDSAWGPKKFYRGARFDTTQQTLRIPSGLIDPDEGKSYLQIAMAGRSLHRSQDMGQLQRLGTSALRLHLVETAG
ncbi:MAG: PIG-L family deacetylase, partial [Gemmatimonadales bacterium]